VYIKAQLVGLLCHKNSRRNKST